MNNTNKYVLGISSIDGYAHDNSITLLKDGKILFAASEERYSRIKHDGSFPNKAIAGALSFLKVNASAIDTIAVGYPKRKMFSVLANPYFFEIVPFTLSFLLNRNIRLVKDIFSFIRVWSKKHVQVQQPKILTNRNIVYVDHHLAHAASAYFTSGYQKCISLSIDAFGSDLSGKLRSGAIYICDNAKLTEVESIPVYASLGNFFHSVTYMLGFKPGDGEGKTMGLAAYGSPTKTYKPMRAYCPTFNDGQWLPPTDWLAGFIPTIPSIIYTFKSTRFGTFLLECLNKYKKEDVAAGAQKLLEDELLKLIKYLITKYPGYGNICLSGGTFLNVKASKRIMEIKGVDNVFVHPNAGDGGVALGAAFMATPQNKLNKVVGNKMQSCGLGESFSNRQIAKCLAKYSGKVIYNKKRDIVNYTAEQIKSGKVIGWFQGREEWGPRALGFRSVLADPRKIEVKDRINQVLKNREWFMPFAPSILEEEGSVFFSKFRPCPFMTLSFDVVPGKEKLFPAALHIDNTARPNSVNKSNNAIYYKLLKRWYKLTNLPILLNTSFNRHGLPIVNSPIEAIDHLLMSAVDELIIGDYSVVRK